MLTQKNEARASGSSTSQGCPSEPASDAELSPGPDPAFSPQFQRLYDEHFALVWRGLTRLGTPPESLEDAVQDVFFVVHRKFATFRGGSSLTTWLYGIAVRVAKDHRRAATRHKRRVRELGFSIDGSAAHAESPAELVLQREAARVVQDLLERLPEEQRELLVLVELEQLPVSESAVALGLGLRTAQRRLKQARANFDELLSQSTAPPSDPPPQNVSPTRATP